MRLLAAVAALALLSSMAAVPALAVGSGGRFLESVSVEEVQGGIEIRIGFAEAVRYVRHTPSGPADEVRIQLAPLGPVGWTVGGPVAESLQPPAGRDGPLDLVRFEVERGEASVELRFRETVAFQVSPTRDLRGLVVLLPAAPRRRAVRRRGVGPPPTPDGAAPEGASDMMEAGRAAFTAGDFQRAALIFDEVARMPENRDSPEARELLGLARERTGQLAHAKAEYEEYLLRYPTGEGADRVRQRLAALTTARSAPRGPLRVRSESGVPLDLQTFGSLYVSYRRESLFSEGVENLMDNSLLTDVHLDTRLRRRGLVLRSQIAASYWHGFLEDGSSGLANIYSAFLEAGNSAGGLSGSIGRRTASTRGVIGRYDGVQVSQPLGESFTVGAIAGFPLDTPEIGDADFDRYLGGANFGAHGLWDAVDLNLFAIGQSAAGGIDRAALGSELRYFADGKMAVAFLDFDVYYQALNVAQLVGTWQVTPRAFVSATLDHRSVPILTTSNALIGQPVGDLDQLSKLFSDSEIEKLAKDRTGHATTLSLNGSYDLTPQIQLGGDFITTDFGGTDTSGGVEGFDGNGFEFGYTARLTTNDVFAAREIMVTTLRYIDGSSSDFVGTTFDARYPITPAIRLNPRLWADYRINDKGADLLRVIPSLRCDWRVWRFQFETEVGFEWYQPMGGSADGQMGYFTMLGIRYDF